MSPAIAVDRLDPVWSAERGRDVLGDPGERVAAQLERLHELLLGVGELVGRVEALDPLQQAFARPAVGRDLGLEVSSSESVGRLVEPLEELAAES